MSGEGGGKTGEVSQILKALRVILRRFDFIGAKRSP